MLFLDSRCRCARHLKPPHNSCSPTFELWNSLSLEIHSGSAATSSRHSVSNLRYSKCGSDAVPQRGIFVLNMPQEQHLIPREIFCIVDKWSVKAAIEDVPASWVSSSSTSKLLYFKLLCTSSTIRHENKNPIFRNVIIRAGSLRQMPEISKNAFSPDFTLVYSIFDRYFVYIGSR